MMAAVILKGMNVDTEVSAATLDAKGTVISAKGCAITAVSAEAGKLSFTRLDETNPWPVHAHGANALKLMPEILDLSRYMLTVKGLPEGNYKITINGKEVGKVASSKLEAGWNMTMAVGERSAAIHKLLYTLQGRLNNDWRKASKENDAEKLAAAQAAIEACETELQELLQPAPVQVVISR